MTIEENTETSDAPTTDTTDTLDIPTTTPTENNRPEWLPEKFRSPEDLLQSYKSLESKLGTPQEPETIKFEDYTSEYNTTGNISDKSIEALEAQGIPKQLVNDFIAGQKARITQMEHEIKNSIGGEETYNTMVEWANKNLTDEDRTTYNSAVTRDTPTAKLAVQGLYQRYKSSVPDEGNLLTGNTGTSSSNNEYQSIAQLRKDMGSKEYKTDEAFRKTVEDRLRNSNIL